LVSDKKAIYTNSYRTQSYPDYDRWVSLKMIKDVLIPT
jgi:hypothetical protein